MNNKYRIVGLQETRYVGGFVVMKDYCAVADFIAVFYGESRLYCEKAERLAANCARQESRNAGDHPGTVAATLARSVRTARTIFARPDCRV